LGAKDICRLLAQLALDLFGIDSQAFSYIVDCLLNSGLSSPIWDRSIK
jgi:hypothetical protein